MAWRYYAGALLEIKGHLTSKMATTTLYNNTPYHLLCIDKCIYEKRLHDFWKNIPHGYLIKVVELMTRYVKQANGR